VFLTLLQKITVVTGSRALRQLVKMKTNYYRRDLDMVALSHGIDNLKFFGVDKKSIKYVSTFSGPVLACDHLVSSQKIFLCVFLIAVSNP
jgi:hypothetical protein